MKETATYKKFKNSPADNFPKFIVVHHTGGENGVDTSNQSAKIVEDYHLSLGWEGIGYHFFIAKNGDVSRGRPEHYHGAHVKEDGMNNKSIGICLAGNFDVTYPTEAQIEELTQLLKDLMAKYNIPAMSIFPHRHYALNRNGKPYKSCYGSKLNETWARDLVSNIPPPPKDCTVEVGIAKKGLIETIINFLKTLL